LDSRRGDEERLSCRVDGVDNQDFKKKIRIYDLEAHVLAILRKLSFQVKHPYTLTDVYEFFARIDPR